MGRFQILLTAGSGLGEPVTSLLILAVNQHQVGSFLGRTLVDMVKDSLSEDASFSAPFEEDLKLGGPILPLCASGGGGSPEREIEGVACVLATELQKPAGTQAPLSKCLHMCRSPSRQTGRGMRGVDTLFTRSLVRSTACAQYHHSLLLISTFL